MAESANIYAPWRLILAHKSCIGSHAEIYNLGVVDLKERAVVAQQAYLCGGSHDFSHPHLPLVTAPIVLGEDSFIGARAIVLLGVTIGEGAVIGAGSVVAKDVAPWTVVAGNPAVPVKRRVLKDSTASS